MKFLSKFISFIKNESDFMRINMEKNDTILITTKQVLEKIGLGRTKLYYLTESPDFPKPIRFAQNCIRWDLNEIEAWIQANKARRS